MRRETRRHRELEEKLQKLEADLKTQTARSNREASPHKEQDPFTEEIMKAKVPKDFKAPDMTLYDGTSDPSHHLSNFISRMYLTDTSDATRCKAFSTTLTKTVIKWFENLPPRSITSFDDLTKKFLSRFSIQKDSQTCSKSTRNQTRGKESLRNYMERFNKACLDIQNLSTEAAIMGLINGLRKGPFSQSISKKHLTSLNEVQEQAEKYINMEENTRLGETSKTEFSYPSRDKDKEPRKKEDQPTEKLRKYHNHTPLRGLDLLGPFPQGSWQVKFLIVGIWYFTKWIEAEPLATATSQRSQKFLYRNIVTRFGISHSITMDNGTQFTDTGFKNLVADLKIKHQFTSVEHPQANE
ncbi:uncharacterized protein LOC130981222 [Arachis stenosperma]|uniref:uncharacterized protein LOC130981222 n=1 Tax=Arachis stenosperma TaxID=217475 RepID=UPI0025AD7C0A|nr:uncharacterized protein LOC130981222 [Arachis stenosperma]